jgi:hypothetical protein
VYIGETMGQASQAMAWPNTNEKYVYIIHNIYVYFNNYLGIINNVFIHVNIYICTFNIIL